MRLSQSFCNVAAVLREMVGVEAEGVPGNAASSEAFHIGKGARTGGVGGPFAAQRVAGLSL
eukprot:9237436-Lingulodinium_polyedra.AAC.1